jgi:AraC-like DNA-binding protein
MVYKEASMKAIMNLGPPLLRFAHPMAFATFLRNMGSPADRYLRQNGLPVLCEDPNAFAPLQRIWSFFDSASRNQAPELGWLVGAHVGDRQLNAALLRKIENAPTLLQALRRFERLYESEATDLEIGIKEHRDSIWLYTRYQGKKDNPGYHVSQAYQLGLFIDLIRHFLGRQWLPHTIGTESNLVPPGATECFPGSRILTRQPAGYVAVSRRYLHQSSPHKGTKGGKVEKPFLNNKLPSPNTNATLESRLRSVLRAYLSEGYISEWMAAELMNTSMRTLTRRLSACGLTYGTVMDDLRFEVAKEKLSKPDMRIGDIANCIGFKYQADFTRMFTRVSGVSPRDYRKTVLN